MSAPEAVAAAAAKNAELAHSVKTSGDYFPSRSTRAQTRQTNRRTISERC